MRRGAELFAMEDVPNGYRAHVRYLMRAATGKVGYDEDKDEGRPCGTGPSSRFHTPLARHCWDSGGALASLIIPIR
jgi:hypothetical protein